MSDLISRQDAIDAIRKHEINLPIYAPRETDVFWDDAIDCCVSVLEQLPSAEPDIPMRGSKSAETAGNITDRTTGDCISRQAAIDEIARWIGYLDDDMIGRIQFGLKRLPKPYRDTIDAQPTIEPRCETCEAFNKTRLLIPQPERTGRWIPQDHNKRHGNVTTCMYYCPVCSECGHTGDFNMNYCPFCGARMEGVEHEGG